MCGVELLLPNPLYYYRFVVDTRSACLGVPDEVFENLTSLLPLECKKGTCYLPKNVALNLPTLSFRAMTGESFVISLNDLIIHSSRQLCLNSASRLVLGTRPLRSLFVAFSGKRGSVRSSLPLSDRMCSV